MIRQKLSGAITNSIIHHVMGIPFVDAQGMGLYGMKWQPPASLRAQRPLKDVRDEYKPQRKVNWIHATSHPYAIPDDGRRYKVLEVAEAERALKAVDQLAKPKRVRSRHKPLTEDDIVVGCSYVPKKGNQFSPNFEVLRRSDPDIEAGEHGVLLEVRRQLDVRTIDLATFLTLVSRKA